MGQSAKKTKDGCRPDQLFGVWAIEPKRLQAFVEAARSVDVATLAAVADENEGKERYELLPGGIARISLNGPLTKYPTSFQAIFGGTSMLQAREAVRQAVRDRAVKGLLLWIDSPGGTTAGVGDLADAVRAAAGKKPVHAYIEDLGASAAYWVGSQASRLWVNPTGWVGSIGTYAVLDDTSGMYDAAGVKVHVVSSGGVKGAYVDGAPVGEDLVAEVQRIVDETTAQFTQAVSRGRDLPIARVRELADGRIHVATQARDLGLVDAVGTSEEALRQLVKETVMSADDTAAAVALAEEQQARAERLEAELAETKAELEALKNPPPQKDPLADASPEVRERLEAAEKEAKEAKAQLAKAESERRTKAFGEKAKELKLPTEAAGVLEKIEAAVGEENFAKLESLINGLRAQVDESALFGEKGAGGGEASGGAYSQAVALAQGKVKEGKASNLPDALKAVWAERPELWEQYEKERAD